VVADFSRLRSSFRAILNLVPGGPECSILLRRQAQRLSSLHDPGDTASKGPVSAVSLTIGSSPSGAPPQEYAPMSRIRFPLTAVVFTAVMSSSALVAQTSVSPPATKSSPAASAPDSSKPSTATQVETWTVTQWEAAKEEWTKDKAKWADCQEQSSKQKLEGRKSWSFLYTCMTS
jgi:hypothetical protein